MNRKFAIFTLVVGLASAGCGNHKPKVKLSNFQWKSETSIEKDYEHLDSNYNPGIRNVAHQVGKGQLLCDEFKGKTIWLFCEVKLDDKTRSPMVEMVDGVGLLELKAEGDKEPKMEINPKGYTELQPFELVK